MQAQKGAIIVQAGLVGRQGEKGQAAQRIEVGLIGPLVLQEGGNVLDYVGPVDLVAEEEVVLEDQDLTETLVPGMLENAQIGVDNVAGRRVDSRRLRRLPQIMYHKGALRWGKRGQILAHDLFAAVADQVDDIGCVHEGV